MYDSEISINNVILPKEVTNNIIKYSDNKAIQSILSTSSKICNLKSDYDDEIFLGALERELRHVNHNIRIYRKLKMYDIKPGDRLFSYNPYSRYNFSNFIVISVKNDKATVKKVDVLGHIIDDELLNVIVKQEKGELYWRMGHYNLYPGILLYENGPEIKNLNSPYLEHKTLSGGSDVIKIPEIGMTVTVIKSQRSYLYYITVLEEDYMELEYLGDDENVPQLLLVNKIDGDWRIYNEVDNRVQGLYMGFYIENLNNFQIERIGGYIHGNISLNRGITIGNYNITEDL